MMLELCYPDKPVGEFATGKPMEKILRVEHALADA